MLNYKISAVSYLNTIPFIYAINNSELKNSITLSLDYPSACADKLISNSVDIALSPIVLLNSHPDFQIISDYCIGANGRVDTVCLYSEVPLEEIKEIYLDYQSKTSVELLKILCNEYWNIKPRLISSKIGFEDYISGNSAALIIGDRAFSMNDQHEYIYDLSEEWKKFTGLPFVFACWIANKEIDPGFILSLNNVMADGLSNINKILYNIKNKYPDCSNPKDYLTNKISYNLDDSKKESMLLFLNKIIPIGYDGACAK